MALEIIYNKDAWQGEIKQLYITKSTAASHELIAAVAGKRIEVLKMLVYAAGTQQILFTSDSDSICQIGNTGVLTYLELAGFITNIGAAFKITLGQAIATYFYIQYVERD
jgi:hypothetical protein